MEQAGFQADVIKFTTKPGKPGAKPSGEATIHLKTMQAVQACLEHFHGRRWNGEKDRQVQAWVVDSNAMAQNKQVRKRNGAGTRSSATSVSTDVGGPSDIDDSP